MIDIASKIPYGDDHECTPDGNTPPRCTVCHSELFLLNRMTRQELIDMVATDSDSPQQPLKSAKEGELK